MKKLFIPPIIFLTCIFLMFGLNRYFPIREMLSTPYNYLGILPFLLGFIMTTQTARLIKKRDTQISPYGTPRKLLIEGWFKFSRNPIYLGFILSLIGIWFWLGSWSPMMGVLLFMTIIHFKFIPMEERNMKAVFGKDYLQYKSKVRKWI